MYHGKRYCARCKTQIEWLVSSPQRPPPHNQQLVFSRRFRNVGKIGKGLINCRLYAYLKVDVEDCY